METRSYCSLCPHGQALDGVASYFSRLDRLTPGVITGELLFFRPLTFFLPPA